MLENENLYCKLFINYNEDIKEARNLIAKIINGKMDNSIGGIETSFGDMYIDKNDDYKTPKEKRSNDPEDAFLFWKFFIDIDPVENIEKSVYIAEISKLLKSLWNIGINAVAACEFEDELPIRQK